MPTFAIKRNDRLPVVRATLLRDDGSVADLTTATEVRFKIGAPLNINGSCDIITRAAGIVEYPWGATDTAAAGNHRAEFEVLWSSGKKETFPNDGYLVVQIYEDLG